MSCRSPTSAYTQLVSISIPWPQQTTISIEALKGLDIQDGDEFIGKAHDDKVTLSLDKRELELPHMTGAAFGEKWAGKFAELNGQIQKTTRSLLPFIPEGVVLS